MDLESTIRGTIKWQQLVGSGINNIMAKYQKDPSKYPNKFSENFDYINVVGGKLIKQGNTHKIDTSKVVRTDKFKGTINFTKIGKNELTFNGKVINVEKPIEYADLEGTIKIDGKKWIATIKYNAKNLVPKGFLSPETTQSISGTHSIQQN